MKHSYQGRYTEWVKAIKKILGYKPKGFPCEIMNKELKTTRGIWWNNIIHQDTEPLGVR